MEPNGPEEESKSVGAVRQKQLLQSLSQQERAALEELCDFNDISDETLRLRPDSIVRLEMFMFNFPRIRCLQLFSALKSLALMQQTFRCIEGLETCVNLESLWLCENKIERIDGLSKCLKLRELFLHSNQISRIENLGHLRELESLWLANNTVECIEGLTSLVKLRNLNLARNPISSIGASLSPNQSLETLNLADTKIGSFKEIACLARLPKLIELYLSDPHWGQSPVAQLCNYQTYVLFSMGDLRVLDALEITDEIKVGAEAIYMKKRMYYNMKIKTLQRKTSHGVKLAQEGKTAQISQTQAVLAALTRLQKDVEQELQNVSSDATEDKTVDGPLLKKHKAASSAVEKVLCKIEEVESNFERCKRETYALSDAHMRRLKLELETGGNTRLEDGNPSDVWFASCSDLITSRFFPADFVRFGITGVRVTRVTRVQNRWLRHRFEATLEEKVDTSDSNYKRALEYLFTGDDLSQTEKLQSLVEDGFEEPVSLTNSLALADVPRLQSCTSGDVTSALSGLTGRVLVSKVFLGKTQEADNHAVKQNGVKFNSALRPSSGAQQLTATGLRSESVDWLEYPGANSVCFPSASDEKQCTWVIANHALALPEYVVEFEYLVDRGLGALGQAVVKAGRPSLKESDVKGETDALERVDPDVRAICRPLAPFLTNSKLPAGKSSMESCKDEAYLTVLNIPPLLTSRQRTLMMTEETIQRQSHVATLSNVTCLNLHNNSIRKIEALSGLLRLKFLILSFNSLQRLEGLEDLKQLEKLDVSYNYIKRVDGLKGLHALRTLDLTANQVYKLEDMSTLKRNVPLLTSLSLRNNPVTESRAYHETVRRKLKHLVELDGRAITEHSRESSEALLSISPSMIREALASQPNIQIKEQGWQNTLSTTKRNEESWTQREYLDGCHLYEVTDLILEHRKLRGLQGLEILTKLRRLSLRDNDIADVDLLGRLSSLEELNLEENRIVKINGLESLTRLCKLELGRNRISSCESIARLTGLTQLSLEDNEVRNLEPLASLSSLMELYLANNQVAEMKQVLLLKQLPKLIILDLSGNPVCEEAEYRAYTLYSLRRLKVLDGLGIDNGELCQAIAKYTGRLTTELLQEKTGRQSLDLMKSLDLCDMKLRDCGSVFTASGFAALTELNLDQNGLTDVPGLRSLSRLVILRLNNNKIDDRPLIEAASSGPVESPGGIHASLEVLHLAGNAITSMAALKLQSFAKLTVLMLQDNEIIKIDGLDGLSRLDKLVLDRNKIKAADASSFSGALRLRELRVEENSVRSLAHFGALKSLRHLYLGANRISELGELERLAELTGLTKLSLVNNQITRRQMYRTAAIAQLPNLQTLDGARISDEERQQACEATSSAEALEATPSVSFSGGLVNKVSLKVNTMQLEFPGPMLAPPQPLRLLEPVKGFEVLKPLEPQSSARNKSEVRRTVSLPVRKVEVGLEKGLKVTRSSIDDFERLVSGSNERSQVKRAAQSPARRASEFPGRMLVARPLSRDRNRPPRMSAGPTSSREPQTSLQDAIRMGKTFPKGLSLKDYYTR